MSWTGFTEDQNDPENSKIQLKTKMSTKKQKERLLLAATNSKTNSVVECSLPPAARLVQSPPTTPVKLLVSGNGRISVQISAHSKIFNTPLPPKTHKHHNTCSFSKV